jgi:hypothetical protein
MTKHIVRDAIYRCRRFDAEIIELCVRWHITCRGAQQYLVSKITRHTPPHLSFALNKPQADFFTQPMHHPEETTVFPEKIVQGPCASPALP